MAAEWVVACTVRTEAEAQLAAASLEAGGIESRIAADDAGGVAPGITFARGVRVFVRSADLEEAQALLEAPAADPRADADEPESPPTPPGGT